MPVIAMPQMGHSTRRNYMKSKYSDALLRAGATGHWIDLSDKDKAVEAALRCDGLLLPGGGDVDPHIYGEEPIPECGAPSVLRDAAEPAMLKAFIEAGKPVLGICRGCQVMNVYFGGTLHQHINPFVTDDHWNFNDRLRGSHNVTLVPDTMMQKVFGEETLFVNSIHHQAIKDVGKGLKVFARSTDGIVEGIELEGYPFCVAVQWHPEHLHKHNPIQSKLFSAFVNAARKK